MVNSVEPFIYSSEMTSIKYKVLVIVKLHLRNNNYAEYKLKKKTTAFQ